MPLLFPYQKDKMSSGTPHFRAPLSSGRAKRLATLRFVVSLLLTLIAAISMATPAYALPLQGSWRISNTTTGTLFDYLMTVQQSGSNYQVTFTATNNGTADGWFRGFGVKNLFNGTLSLVSFAPSGSALGSNGFSGYVNENTSNNDYCKTDDGSHPAGTVCAELSVAGNIVVHVGQNLIFSFVVNGATPTTPGGGDNWHLQTKVFDSSSGNGALGSISAAAVLPPPPAVPEPASLALVGGGLALVVRKLRKSKLFHS